MTEQDANRTPIDQALDLFVFLPVGFVLELPRSIPRFIERGRRELAPGASPGSTGFGSASALDRVQAHAMGTLRALGVLQAEDHPIHPGVPAEPSATPATPETGRPAAATSPETGAAPLDGAPAAGVDPDTLAIPGYDSLSASQVMPRLESLSPDELELIRRYEHANRERKTILNKIAQLQAG